MWGLWTGKPHLEKGRFPLEGATGFLARDPEPSIIVGANGPKMAALADASPRGSTSTTKSRAWLALSKQRTGQRCHLAFMTATIIRFSRTRTSSPRHEEFGCRRPLRPNRSAG